MRNIALKAMNDILSELGLVLYCLVFGLVPRPSTLSTNVPNQKKRIKALGSAQTEESPTVTEKRVYKMLIRKFSPAAYRRYKLKLKVHIRSDVDRIAKKVILSIEKIDERRLIETCV